MRSPYLLLLALLLLSMTVISTGMGYLKISPLEVIEIIVARLGGSHGLLRSIDPVFPYVVWEVRLPRVLASATVGAGLSISGVIFQGILLNPLADPYTLGISAGAAFGASIALLLNITVFGFYSVPISAFFGAISTLVVVMALSCFDGDISSNNLILSGIIVSAILSAGISLFKYMANEQVSVIVFWLMGSFASETWPEVFLASACLLVGFLISMAFARDLNIMSLGDRSASSLGISANKVRAILLITASFVTAVCVSVSGIIGFVGLIVPHLMRLLIGADNRGLIPASALAGASLLLGADTITRAILPVEVPIGVLTALIGGPFFCYIFRKKGIGRLNA